MRFGIPFLLVLLTLAACQETTKYEDNYCSKEFEDDYLAVLNSNGSPEACDRLFSAHPDVSSCKTYQRGLLREVSADEFRALCSK